jgi:hypothetical protein
MFVIGCLFSIRLLWASIMCAYCMVIRLICLNVFRICGGGSLSFVSSSFIKGMWVVALAPAASTYTMSGAVFQPLAMILLMSGWYSVVFMSLVSAVYLSLQYVNSINYIGIFGVGDSGGGWLYGWPRMHMMSCLTLALQ